MKPIKKSDQDTPWAKKQTIKKPYQVSAKEVAKIFRIICEGENTEPFYFKSFRLGNAEVEAYGTGRTKTALVNHVLKKEFNKRSNTDKEIWVVFDFDIKLDQVEQQKEDYNRAIELAANKGIRVAYSNDSFELWFLLHYQRLDSQWTREQYYEKLSEYWGCNYKKDGKEKDFCKRIYKKLLEDPQSQEVAISRASRMLSEQQELPFADRNPCTTVFELVTELNEYLK